MDNAVGAGARVGAKAAIRMDGEAVGTIVGSEDVNVAVVVASGVWRVGDAFGGAPDACMVRGPGGADVGLGAAGDIVGEVLGIEVVGDALGPAVGAADVGSAVGPANGADAVGNMVGLAVGADVVGTAMGTEVGVSVVGTVVGAVVGLPEVAP